jgi:hypothetical protein
MKTTTRFLKTAVKLQTTSARPALCIGWQLTANHHLHHDLSVLSMSGYSHRFFIYMKVIGLL